MKANRPLGCVSVQTVQLYTVNRQWEFGKCLGSSENRGCWRMKRSRISFSRTHVVLHCANTIDVNAGSSRTLRLKN